MNNGKLPFAWPAPVREAVIVQNTKVLTLREQALDHLQDRANYLEIYHKDIVDAFKASPLNGQVIIGKHEDGTENPKQSTYVLGSSSVLVECDDDMMPKLCCHAFDLQADPVVSTSEASVIAQVIEAFIYGHCPSKAAFILGMGKKYLRNAHTVNGIEDLAERLKADPFLMNNAVSGANIEKEEITDVPVK